MQYCIYFQFVIVSLLTLRRMELCHATSTAMPTKLFAVLNVMKDISSTVLQIVFVKPISSGVVPRWSAQVGGS